MERNNNSNAFAQVQQTPLGVVSRYVLSFFTQIGKKNRSFKIFEFDFEN